MSEEKIIQRDVLAQDIMDLFYQDFRDDNEAFFDLDFFIRQVNDTYEAVLRQQYIDNYAMLRSEGRHISELVNFDSQWLRAEVTKIEVDKKTKQISAKLTGKVFSFPFDQSNVGLQNIVSVVRGKCNLVRSSMNESWIDRHAPKTDVTFWWPEGDTIMFDKNCCDEVRVYYVAVPDKDTILQQGLANLIKETVLKLMFAAKDGNFVDETNDSNKNKNVQSETNKEAVQ